MSAPHRFHCAISYACEKTKQKQQQHNNKKPSIHDCLYMRKAIYISVEMGCTNVNCYYHYMQYETSAYRFTSLFDPTKSLEIYTGESGS
jgi:hypothetical protein